LRRLSIDATSSFVLNTYGEPTERDDVGTGAPKGKQRNKFMSFIYDAEYYWMEIIFYEQKVHSFTVILKDPTLSVSLAGLGGKRLGEVSFASFDDQELDMRSTRIDEHSTAWGYVESFFDNDLTGSDIISIGYAATGAAYRDYSQLKKNPLEAFLVSCGDKTADKGPCEEVSDDSLTMNSKWSREVKADIDGKEELSELRYFRKEVFPNAYHVQSGYLYNGKDKPPPDISYLFSSKGDGPTFADFLWLMAATAEVGCRPECPSRGD
jgi:hypothetical protein